MEAYLMWIILGIALIIIEMLTGTFYLLVLGASAMVSALAAWLGAPILAQVLAGGAVALAGTLFLNRWRKGEAVKNHAKDVASNALDLGQTVHFEEWVDETNRLARVHYRGTTWDAKVAAGLSPQPNETLFIARQEGTMLHVASGML